MPAFEDRYNKLNPEQKRAVDTIDGAVLVVAGPGSGKTEILTLRVANILKQTDVGANSILCLTFTDSAANTMRTRLAQLIGNEAYRVQIGTFHAFAQRVAQQYPTHFAQGADLIPAEAVEQRELVAEAIRALPLRDPLRSEHPSEGLTYLSDAVARISELKKAGITPDVYARIIAHNRELVEPITKLLEPLTETVSKKKLSIYAGIAQQLRALPAPIFPLRAYDNLAISLARSLEGAVLEAEAQDSSTPISSWKAAHLTKTTTGHVLKASRQLPALTSLATVYAGYQEALRTKGLRDFDDLVLDLLEALRAQGDLRAALQEEYQYILVDEYQDTNGAQAELLALLADNPVASGNPNLMVVGDDDQAIYRFHGAGLEHLLAFTEHYPKAVVITMTTNYRSHQSILDLAQEHIAQAKERLEGRIPGLSKKLSQGGAHTHVRIASITGTSREDERACLCSLIQQRLQEGVAPEEIAVLGRRNRDLDAMLPHLYAAGIPVSYDRQRNALDDPHIVELIELARVVVALQSGATKNADALMPQILGYAFWGVSRINTWLVLRKAHSEKKAVIEVLLESEDLKLKAIGELLIDIASRAASAPATELLDELMGSTATPEGRQSPWRAFHIPETARVEQPTKLLTLVGALRSVLKTFTEARRGQPTHLADFVAFTDLRRTHHEPIPTQITPQTQGVQLLTAHRAKGMEFNVVCVLHVSADVWQSGGRGKRISFPENLPLSPAGDSLDDQLRTLYVALTRARSELYLGVSPSDSTRAKDEPLPLLAALPEEAIAHPTIAPEIVAWENHTQPLQEHERAALVPLVAEHRLTPTQLNDFLDLVHGGPEVFFERHILRFPQHESEDMRFGSAMHSVLETIALGIHRGEAIPNAAQIETLVVDALTHNEFFGPALDAHTKLGIQTITAYCAQRSEELKAAAHVEVSFYKDNLRVGDAWITGKADVIQEQGNEITIVDYKTGKARSDWEEKGKEAQLYGYRRQLLFYAILAQLSPRFKDKEIAEAKLTFVVPDTEGIIHDLVLKPEAHEVDRTAELIQAIYRKVQALDFPNVGAYSKDLKGIEAFEEDLLTGKA